MGARDYVHVTCYDVVFNVYLRGLVWIRKHNDAINLIRDRYCCAIATYLCFYICYNPSECLLKWSC